MERRADKPPTYGVQRSTGAMLAEHLNGLAQTGAQIMSVIPTLALATSEPVLLIVYTEAPKDEEP